MPARTPAPASGQRTIWDLRWRWLPGAVAAADEQILADCARLFSEHYGTWGARGTRPGEPIRISADQVKALLSDSSAWLAAAYADNELVGYAIAARVDAGDFGRIDWVSQLVVHGAYRKARVATTLLYSIWGFSDCWAWGLATANPFAVRALETATRRRCSIRQIRIHGDRILREVSSHVPYIPSSLDRAENGATLATLDTGFFVDHSELPKMLKGAARSDRPWPLGQVEEGHEWFAATFRAQPVHALDDRHLQDLLLGSDSIWIQAYESMTLDERHRWHSHHESEVDYILEQTRLAQGRVLDVGCGDGRHAAELARRGFQVIAVDVAPRLIERARENHSQLPIAFEVADARKSLPEGPFDLVLCLYDVLGSSAEPDDDRLLVRNLSNALAPGGYLVASVMNTMVTLGKLLPERRPATIAEFVEALETLPPSAAMETSGGIFAPQNLLYFNGLYYRKEQFDAANWRLPAELVVRDKRYTESEFADLLRQAGLQVREIRPVRAGHWGESESLAEEGPDAGKELLAFAMQ